MGNIASTVEEEDDAWGRAMDPDNHLSWRERQHHLLRDSLTHAFAEEAHKEAVQKRRAQQIAEANIPGDRLMRIMYSSRMQRSAEQRDPLQEISLICVQSARSNQSLRIGGCLAFDQATGLIVQVLEGPETAVRKLLERIAADPRHAGLHIEDEVLDVPPDARKHAGFGMRLVTGGRAAEESAAPDIADFIAEPCSMIIYSSLLNATCEGAANELVAQILRASTRNNPRLRVGGELFLDTSSGQIVQVLEGPTRTVRELYAKIDRDLRHDHCTIISEEPIPAGTRRYPEWGMSQTDFAHLSAQLGGAACARAAALLQSWRDGETHATKGEREARARRRTSFSEAELTA